MGQRVFLKEYDFNLTAGGIAIVLAEAEYFRIQASSGAVSIMIDGLGELPNLQAGQGIKSTPFKRLTIRDVSGAANVGRILVSNQEFIDNRTYGVNSLDAATMANLKLTTPRPEAANGSFSDASVLVANTPIIIFTPAANVNGAILLGAQCAAVENGNPVYQSFLAKNAAPASTIDGLVLLGSQTITTVAGYSTFAGKIEYPQLIAAGLGLYFISEQALAANTLNKRSARYKLL